MLFVILNVHKAEKKVHAFCMDAKGTEGKNYTYCYLERLKYVGIYWTFVKMVLEHNFILGRSCPYHSRVFLPPFPRASSLASFSYFPNPFFLKTTLTPVLPPSPPPYFSYLICSEVNPVASPVFQLFSAFHAASL